VIIAVAIIVFIVYTTDTRVHQKQFKTPVHLRQTEEVIVVTHLDPKQPDPAIISADINDAIERVGLVCCLTTMLFFAAPLSNLVSVIMPPKFAIFKTYELFLIVL